MKTRIYSTGPIPYDQYVPIMPENLNRLGFILYVNTDDGSHLELATKPYPLSHEIFRVWDTFRAATFIDLDWVYTGALYAKAVSTRGSSLYVSIIEWSKDQ